MGNHIYQTPFLLSLSQSMLGDQDISLFDPTLLKKPWSKYLFKLLDFCMYLHSIVTSEKVFTVQFPTKRTLVRIHVCQQQNLFSANFLLFLAHLNNKTSPFLNGPRPLNRSKFSGKFSSNTFFYRSHTLTIWDPRAKFESTWSIEKGKL